jgi:cell wall-associated NlpC family hydrolase
MNTRNEPQVGARPILRACRKEVVLVQYHRKAAVLGLIGLLLTLASTVFGDTMPTTLTSTATASGSDSAISTTSTDSSASQGVPLMSTHRDETGNVVQVEYEVTPNQITRTTAKPVPTPVAQPATPVENKVDSVVSTIPSQAQAALIETTDQTPMIDTIPTRVSTSATPYAVTAPQLTPVSSKSPKIGLAKPQPAAPKPMRNKWQAQSKPAPKPASPIAPKKDPGFIAKALTATKGLMNRAVSWLGTRYVWGGISKSGVDCSGLTKLLYQAEGISLPHLAKLQFQRGMAVARAALLPGDLVFFNTARGPLTHVGIYIGNGQFLHAANPRRGVRVDKLDSNYYTKRFAGARRMKTLG